MTREEQIRQAGIEYTIKNRPMCIGGGAFSKVVDEMNRNPAFEAGAKWADESWLNKACEYLYEWNRKQVLKHGSRATVSCSEYTISVHDFRKAMKGE